MRLYFLFKVLFALSFQGLSQQIYFEPKEISSECVDSDSLSIELLMEVPPNSSLFRNNKGSYCLCIHNGDSIKCCEIASYNHELILTDTIDITGDKKPELLLVFSSRSGHSGWLGGLSESYSYLEVYDLYRKQRILTEDLMYNIETWSNTLEEPLDSIDTTDEIKIIDSYTEVECYSMKYVVSEDCIIFKPSLESGDCPESEEMKSYTLKWTTTGFIEF